MFLSSGWAVQVILQFAHEGNYCGTDENEKEKKILTCRFCFLRTSETFLTHCTCTIYTTHLDMYIDGSEKWYSYQPGIDGKRGNEPQTVHGHENHEFSWTPGPREKPHPLAFHPLKNETKESTRERKIPSYPRQPRRVRANQRPIEQYMLSLYHEPARNPSW